MGAEQALRLLEQALRAPDPVAAVHRLARSRGMPLSLRRQLLGADPDGLRISALLVAKLRFERLLRGSPQAEQWFDADPADFALAFGRYHQEVKPTAFFPSQEARLFKRWLAQQGR